MINKLTCTAFLIMWCVGCHASTQCSCPSPCPCQIVNQVESSDSLLHCIFVDSPVDIVHFGDMPELAAHVDSLGVGNVYYVNPPLRGYLPRLFSRYAAPSAARLAEAVRWIKSRDPENRVVLVGYSSGAIYVLDALKILQQDSIPVDSVVYLDSAILKPFVRKGHPQNVADIALVYRSRKQPPEGLPNSEVFAIDEKKHLSVPTHPQSIDALMTVLGRLSDGGSELVKDVDSHRSNDSIRSTSNGVSSKELKRSAARDAGVKR